MSGALIIAVAAVYAFVATDQILKDNVGLGIAFAGYAFSNVGLYIAAK